MSAGENKTGYLHWIFVSSFSRHNFPHFTRLPGSPRSRGEGAVGVACIRGGKQSQDFDGLFNFFYRNVWKYRVFGGRVFDFPFIRISLQSERGKT